MSLKSLIKGIKTIGLGVSDGVNCKSKLNPESLIGSFFNIRYKSVFYFKENSVHEKCKDFSSVELAFLLRFVVTSLACADEMPRCTCTIAAWLLRQMLCVAGQGMVAADNYGR